MYHWYGRYRPVSVLLVGVWKMLAVDGDPYDEIFPALLFLWGGWGGGGGGGNPLVTGRFPSQRERSDDRVSLSWRIHAKQNAFIR